MRRLIDVDGGREERGLLRVCGRRVESKSIAAMLPDETTAPKTARDCGLTLGLADGCSEQNGAELHHVHGNNF